MTTPLPAEWKTMTELERAAWLDANLSDEARAGGAALREKMAADAAVNAEAIARTNAREDVRVLQAAAMQAGYLRDDARKDGTGEREQRQLELLADAASELARLAWSRAYDLPAHLARVAAEEARVDAERAKSRARAVSEQRASRRRSA